MNEDAGTERSHRNLKRTPKRRTGFLAITAAVLSLLLMGSSAFWTYCYFTDAPVRLGKLSIYSLRRDSTKFDYSGRLVFVPNPRTRWTVDQDRVTISLTSANLGNFISPKIYRLPGLVLTTP